MVNIIPMAGLGTRFSDEGYLLPKPLIPVSGVPMIQKVIEGLPSTDKWIFIVRKEHVTEHKIDALITSILPNAIIVIDPDPHGQAATTMLAMPYIKDDEELFIAACDNSFLYNQKQFEDLKKRDDIDAIIWTFTQNPLLTAKPTAWGWTKLSSDGETITDMSVKIPVSENPYNDHAVVATFYFKRAADFIHAYHEMVAAEHRINGEFYIDAMPIFLKKIGKKSVIFDIDLYVSWGKPADLYLYQREEAASLMRKISNERTDSLWDKFFSMETPTKIESHTKKQLARFLVTGVSAVLCDYFVYTILLIFLSHSPAKAISFLSGALLAFFLNKTWTFKESGRGNERILHFFVLYGLGLLLNVGINKFILYLLPAHITLAFVIATGTSATWNFIGQKIWVFRA